MLHYFRSSSGHMSVNPSDILPIESPLKDLERATVLHYQGFIGAYL